MKPQNLVMPKCFATYSIGGYGTKFTLSSFAKLGMKNWPQGICYYGDDNFEKYNAVDPGNHHSKQVSGIDL